MSKATAKSLDDYRAEYDPDVIYPNRLRKALEEMLKEGPENWAVEQEFLTRAGVSNNYISAYREKFAAHIVETRGKNPKRIWFADPKVAAKARKP